MVTLKDNFCLSTEGRQQSVLDIRLWNAFQKMTMNGFDLEWAGLRELDSIKRDL